jgi:hypothetical protein
LYEQKKGLQINRLEITGGTFYYDVSLDTSSRDSSFSGFTATTWVLVLPDQPITQNADLVEGNTLTWHLAPLSGVHDMKAESSIAAPLGALIVAALVLLLIAAGAYFVVRRTKG